MTKKQILALIKQARVQFSAELWGFDDDIAVNAFVKILKKLLKEAP